MYNLKQNVNYKQSSNGTLIVNNVPKNSSLVLDFGDSEQIHIPANKIDNSISYFNKSLGGHRISAHLETEPFDLTSLIDSIKLLAIELSKTIYEN